MANDQLVKLEVSDELIRSIVTKQVSAAILTAMGGREEFLEKIVTAVFTTRVNNEGKITGYSSDNYQWLDVLIRQMIQEAARTAVKCWIEQNKPLLEKAVLKGFQGQSKQMATAFATGLLQSIQSSWQFKVDVNFNSNKS